MTQFHHTAWTAKDGAPSQITALAQTTDGYLWIGAARGLFRFDGIEFERYVPPLDVTLPAQNIYALQATPDGGLWISFRPFGLGFLKDGQMKIFSRPEDSPQSEVFCLAQDKDNRIWAGTLKGLALFDGTRWIELGSEWNVKNERVWAMFADRDGTFWVAVGETVVYLPRGSKSFRQTGIRSTDVPRITQSPDGRLWITEWDMPVRTIQIRDQNVTVQNSEIQLKASAMHFDRDGSLWMIGSSIEGIKRLRFPEKSDSQDTGELESFGEQDGLTSTTVGNILEDREGNIWVSSTTGLNRFSRRPLVAMKLPQNYQIFALLAGENGDIWASSSHKNPLLKINGERINEASPPMDVSSLYRDANGTVWWGSQGKIWKQSKNSFESFSSPVSLKDSFWEIFSGGESGGIWARLGDIGLFHFKNGVWTNTEKPKGLPERLPSASFDDQLGRIWLGYSTEVVCFINGGQTQCFSRDNGIDIGKIKVIRGRGEHIWFGGEKGLAVFYNGLFKTINTVGESFGSVSGIVETANGGLWLNEAHGIVHIPPEEIRQLIDSPNYRVNYRLYDILDGMPGGAQLIYAGSTAVEASDGRLWFATDNGLAWIDPTRIEKNTLPPPVVVKSLATDERTYQTSETLELPKGTENLRINYTALSLSVPERVRFKYRLEGFDKDWRDAGTHREAFFTNLGPGAYRFRVIASNNDGVWNEEGAALEFTILPRFYQTKWFFALCVTAFLFVMWLGYKWRVRQVKNLIHLQYQERLNERTRIAQDFHDTLLQGFVSASMQMDVAINKLPAETPGKPRLDRVLGLLVRLVEEGRNTVDELRSVEHNFSADFEQEFAQVGHKLDLYNQMDFRVVVEGSPRPPDPVIGGETFHIVNEALVNAFRHAGASVIEIKIEYTAKSLKISVRDDGCGIKPDILNSGRRGHWGLTGMRERAEKMGARLKIRSCPVEGTEVELSVPNRIAFNDRSMSFFNLRERLRNLFRILGVRNK